MEETMASEVGIKVLNPTIEPDTEKSLMAIRPESLDGVTIGLLANGKRNSSELLRHVYDILKENSNIKLGIEENKGNASRPCPDDILSNVIKSCDVIITASGD